MSSTRTTAPISRTSAEPETAGRDWSRSLSAALEADPRYGQRRGRGPTTPAKSCGQTAISISLARGHRRKPPLIAGQPLGEHLTGRDVMGERGKAGQGGANEGDTAGQSPGPTTDQADGGGRPPGAPSQPGGRGGPLRSNSTRKERHAATDTRPQRSAWTADSERNPEAGESGAGGSREQGPAGAGGELGREERGPASSRRAALHMAQTLARGCSYGALIRQRKGLQHARGYDVESKGAFS